MMKQLMFRRCWHQEALVLGWLLWSFLVLMGYYRQVWRLLVLGPIAWVRDNYSLVVFAGNVRALLSGNAAAWQLLFWQEALVRAATAVLGATLVLLTAQVLGLALRRLLRWSPDDWHIALLYQTALGLGALSYLSLTLAAFGVYYPATLRLLMAVVLVIGALSFGYFLRCSRTPKWTAFRIPIADNMADRVWQFVTLLALAITLVGALAPEVEWDALWYHLWLPKLWLQAGRPVDVVTEYISLYPLTWELIFGAGLVSGGSVAAKLLHFTCLPLTALLVFKLTQRYFPQASPWLATALFVTIPTVLWEATTTYIDLALAFHTGLVVYAWLRYVEERHWQWLVLATATLGLALATKHLALFVLLLVTGGLALRLWLEERHWYRALLPALLLGSLSLLLPLPWYMRSLVASGNPFFPDLYNIFGAFPPGRWSEITEQGLSHFKDSFGDLRTPLNLLLLPWNATVHAARYGGSLGPLFLLLLPALALRHRNNSARWLLAFIIGYVALWASPISSFQMRFLMPITPFLAVLAAEAYSRLTTFLEAIRWSRILARSAIGGLLLLNLPPFTSLHEPDRVIWDGWLTHVIHDVPVGVVFGQESDEAYLARKIPSYTAWQYINTNLPLNARILTFTNGDQFYGERERVPSDSTLGRPAIWGSRRGQEAQALEALRQLGISHLLLDKRQLDAGELDNMAIVRPEFMTEWYELVYEDHRFILYRLRLRD